MATLDARTDDILAREELHERRDSKFLHEKLTNQLFTVEARPIEDAAIGSFNLCETLGMDLHKFPREFHILVSIWLVHEVYSVRLTACLLCEHPLDHWEVALEVAEEDQRCLVRLTYSSDIQGRQAIIAL